MDGRDIDWAWPAFRTARQLCLRHCTENDALAPGKQPLNPFFSAFLRNNPFAFSALKQTIRGRLIQNKPLNPKIRGREMA